MKTLLAAMVPALAYLGLKLGHADAGLSFLSGQFVSQDVFTRAVAYLAAYGCFVLITPTLVLSVVLERMIRALLHLRRTRR